MKSLSAPLSATLTALSLVITMTPTQAQQATPSPVPGYAYGQRTLPASSIVAFLYPPS